MPPLTMGDSSDDESALPLPPEIDWNAMMRDMAPPEWDLLLAAAAKNDKAMIVNLVENQQVPVTHSNGIGQTALHVAVLWGHTEVARYLIEKGAEVNASNSMTGATPLHTVLQSGKLSEEQQVSLITLLLDVGSADSIVMDKFGKYPADYMASTHRYRSMLMKRIAPPPKTKEGLRMGFLKDVARELPGCMRAT